MSRSLTASQKILPIVLVASLAIALLPRPWLRWTGDVAAIAKLPLTPFADAGNLLAGWLRPVPAPVADGADPQEVRALTENIDLLRQRLQAAEQRADELDEQLRQLQQIPEDTFAVTQRRVIARITSRSPAAGLAVVDLRKGERDGVEPNTVAVYAGVHLLGRTGEDVSTFRSTLIPLASRATGLVRAVVGAPAPELDPTARQEVVHLEPAGDGTFVADIDRSRVVLEGDVVRLEDNAWPRTAQQMVIGHVTVISDKDQQPLRRRITVEPLYQVHEVAEVILLIEDGGRAAAEALAAEGGGP